MTGPIDTAAASSPREAFERFQRDILGTSPDLADDLYAEDVVIEMPFARPGMPRRFQGREEFRAFAAPRRASLPVRFEEFRNVVVHETTDPDVIIAEYDLAGTATTTDRRGTAPFVLVLRVRDGRIVHLREYQNVLAIAEALGQLPDLLASMGGRREEPAPADPGS
jgi:ketosteroid isomerase-like protein